VVVSLLCDGCTVVPQHFRLDLVGLKFPVLYCYRNNSGLSCEVPVIKVTREHGLTSYITVAMLLLLEQLGYYSDSYITYSDSCITVALVVFL